MLNLGNVNIMCEQTLTGSVPKKTVSYVYYALSGNSIQK